MSRSGSVYFAHGMESGPWGTKIQALAKIAVHHGLTVHSPDYTHTKDPRERLAHLLTMDLPSGESLVLTGSSLGGWVSAAAAAQLKPRGLFLMAPALNIPGVNQGEAPLAGAVHTEIVHGWHDDVVPVEQSLDFARRHSAGLHLLNAGHTLREVLPEVKTLFDNFLARLKLNHVTT